METNPWVIGLKSARANRIPGLILQGAAFALLAAYYLIPDVRDALDVVAGWQARYGTPFSLASYLLFCGIVPYLFCLALPSLRPREPAKALLFALGFWSVMGLVLPRFYAFQGYLYGNAADARTLVLKVATDQCGYTAFFASPAVSIAHLWKDRGYRWSAMAPLFGRGWYRRLVVPNLVMNWVVWIPSLCVIYSLPAALQSHVAGLIGGFWALMSLQIAAHTQTEPLERQDARRQNVYRIKP
jgi:hypothetical protein